MTKEELQEFAIENKLDVRPIQPWHHRLLDEYEEPVLDVFFKAKRTANRIFSFKVRKWYMVSKTKELKNYV